MKYTVTILSLVSTLAFPLFGIEAPVEADAHTSSTGSSRNSNAGNAQRFIVSPTQKGYLQFDLSALPTDLGRADIARATVRVYASKVSATGAFDVFEVTSPWEEAKIKSTFAPTLAGVAEKTGIAVTSVKRFVTFDITELVRDWVSGDSDNNGIALVASATGIVAQFDSKENAATSHPPTLEITLAHGGIAGSITAYGGAAEPVGWLVCDGSEKVRTEYPDLFAAIGLAWGSGNGSTTFNLPDLRGRFLRGVDQTAGRDPDAASRTASRPGGNTGNSVGSVQLDAFKSHNHSLTYNPVANATEGGPGQVSRVTPEQTNRDDGSVGARGGSETRPVNANVHYIIKY